jgi:hypothetical protein
MTRQTRHLARRRLNRPGRRRLDPPLTRSTRHEQHSDPVGQPIAQRYAGGGRRLVRRPSHVPVGEGGCDAAATCHHAHVAHVCFAGRTRRGPDAVRIDDRVPPYMTIRLRSRSSRLDDDRPEVRRGPAAPGKLASLMQRDEVRRQGRHSMPRRSRSASSARQRRRTRTLRSRLT